MFSPPNAFPYEKKMTRLIAVVFTSLYVFSFVVFTCTSVCHEIWCVGHRLISLCFGLLLWLQKINPHTPPIDILTKLVGADFFERVATQTTLLLSRRRY